jgi:ribosomal protein S18 acetylase RimI-like enzyme
MKEVRAMPGSAHGLADANLVEAIREHARWQDPCECVEEDGVIMVAGANAFPGTFRNCVARIDAAVPAAEVLARAQQFFARRERAFTVILRLSSDKDIDEALKGAGLAPTGDAPGMVIQSRVADAEIPAGIRIERFRNETHVRDAVRVNAEAYQAIKLPAEETRVFFGRPGALLSPRVIGFVAYREALPVSTALTIMSGDGAGVYWVGTASAAQRSGLAEICTRLATNAGFDHGASAVTLQATPFGAALYRRLGYEDYDVLRRYRCPAGHELRPLA